MAIDVATLVGFVEDKSAGASALSCKRCPALLDP
jgi:hypothetical protein